MVSPNQVFEKDKLRRLKFKGQIEGMERRAKAKM